MDDLKINLFLDVTEKGLEITVALTSYLSNKEISSDSIVITNDELLAVAGRFE